MRRFVRRYTSRVYTWLQVLWIYLSVGCHFWQWRVQLWLRQLHLVKGTYRVMKQTLLFIRHGQTTWNAEHTLPGQLPGVALNEKGREQARRLAEALVEIPIS